MQEWSARRRKMKQFLSKYGLLVSFGGCGCLLALCMGCTILALAMLSLYNSDAFNPYAPVETGSPSPAQIDHCRRAFGIKEDAAVEVVSYKYEMGFQDDRLKCTFKIKGQNPVDIFSQPVTFSQEGFAQIAEPGEYFNFQIEKIKDDLWLIEASWFEI